MERNEIYVQYGKFRAGAAGRIGMGVFVFIVIAALAVSHVHGWW